METTAAPPTPSALAFSTDNCTIGRAMAILGERWTVVVLREIFLGVRRFDDIRRHSGIPRQVLTDRLGLLVDQDILRKEPYRDPGSRVRHEYRLTRKGVDLQPVMVAVAEWGDRHLADPEGAAVRIEHRDCGEQVRVRVECVHGHVFDAREVVTRPGPGARPFTGEVSSLLGGL